VLFSGGSFAKNGMDNTNKPITIKSKIVSVLWQRINAFLYERTDSRALNGWPERNIGNQMERIFALPGVKNRRLFEDILARSFCGLAWKGKNPPDVPVPLRSAVGGGMMLLLFSVAGDRITQF